MATAPPQYTFFFFFLFFSFLFFSFFLSPPCLFLQIKWLLPLPNSPFFFSFFSFLFFSFLFSFPPPVFLFSFPLFSAFVPTPFCYFPVFPLCALLSLCCGAKVQKLTDRDPPAAPCSFLLFFFLHLFFFIHFQCFQVLFFSPLPLFPLLKE